MEVFRYQTSQAAARKAGMQASAIIRKAEKAPFLVLFSAGSSFDVADAIDPEVLGSRVTIGMLDERYSRDPSINNFAQFANHALYREGQKQGAHFIDTRVKVRTINKEEVPETFAEFTLRFEQGLQHWKEAHPAGRVLITQGIGEDGHTAGIMPYPLQRERFEELFEKPARWVVGYDAKATSKKTEDSSLKVEREKLRKFPRPLRPFAGDRILFRGNSPLFGGSDPLVGAVKALWSSRLSAAGGVFPLRVTVTLPFLREVVDYSVVYAVGKSKRAALERVLMERKRMWEIPARVIHQMKRVFLFADIA